MVMARYDRTFICKKYYSYLTIYSKQLKIFRQLHLQLSGSLLIIGLFIENVIKTQTVKKFLQIKYVFYNYVLYNNE